MGVTCLCIFIVGTEVVPPIKKVDLETVPQINGVPINEVDIDESIVDKPWRKPGGCGH